VFSVAKPLNDTLELFKRSFVELRLYISDQALPENLRPALQVISQASLLPSDLVVRGEQRNQSDAQYE
jgi:hypothetical protein